ncbi:Tetratricopeptide repeat (TPR)-like superfamily protein [Striga hermonthica]|uniref:Tetratricopeptide repeat (TPR)-like superfamily protein n=1 Tax=Striga hermonthica TaxID=68872 RepID=A0A9N7NRQ4_STRHE|nr:Tetratricopeptide repeat (TPR)-like superfamily protein [Striga hermonthica]
MNALNSSAVKPTLLRHPQAVPLLNPHRPFFSKPSSPLSLRFPLPARPQFSISSPVRASLQNPYPDAPDSRSPNPFNRRFTDGIAPLRSTLATAVAAAALVFAGLCLRTKPSVAESVLPAAGTSERDFLFKDEEREKLIEESLLSNPNDADQLKNLVEIKIKGRKIREAIETIDRLIELEPDDTEWPLLKAHLHAQDGELQLAKNGFNELLNKDPYLVEAFLGLVTVASQEESSGHELKDIERRVEEAMKSGMKEKKDSNLRDFKLLLAQIKVIESKYEEALKVYQDLVKEEPRDFRPYLCQGIIYTLMRKNVEAEKNFEKYRRLVPKGHPYASYFDDNMNATKIIAQAAENERA